MWATVLSFSGIIKLLLGEWATVPTSSMVPTILPGDLIWYEKYSYGAVMPTRISELPVLNLLCLIPAVWEKDKIRNWGYHRTPGFNKPARMDIIVFRNPLDRNQLLTKRIIGLPGDTLTIRRNKIYINGKVIKDIARKKMTWVNAEIGFPTDKKGKWTTLNYGPLPIPKNEADERKNCYFVMGDERGNSLDSRYIGFIPYQSIEGRISHVLYSPKASDYGVESLGVKRIQ
ncbi:signal peptidase I [Phocaeicola sartorii]|uniref:signal peptidase I n=1 Tax=Phocaeicola sartorii TaxID=671267 RepID=UPI0021A97B24|nr:signal peptidase I [Phocaeicola sartorii]